MLGQNWRRLCKQAGVRKRKKRTSTTPADTPSSTSSSTNSSSSSSSSASSSASSSSSSIDDNKRRKTTSSSDDSTKDSSMWIKVAAPSSGPNSTSNPRLVPVRRDDAFDAVLAEAALAAEEAESSSSDSDSDSDSSSSSDSESGDLQRGRTPRQAARLTHELALDCEMVGVGPQGQRSMLARCSVVNFDGEVVFDKFVKPVEPVTDYRTRVSGVRKKDVYSDQAISLRECQLKVGNMLKGRVLVAHAVKNDLDALLLTHPKHMIRDTAGSNLLGMRDRQLSARGVNPGKKRKQRPKALRHLAKEMLGLDIQDGEHDSVTDARVTMALYRLVRTEWERQLQTKKKGRRGHKKKA